MTDHIEKKAESDRERVWRTITTGVELAKWFPDEAAFDLGPGTEGASPDEGSAPEDTPGLLSLRFSSVGRPCRGVRPPSTTDPC